MKYSKTPSTDAPSATNNHSESQQPFVWPSWVIEDRNRQSRRVTLNSAPTANSTRPTFSELVKLDHELSLIELDILLSRNQGVPRSERRWDLVRRNIARIVGNRTQREGLLGTVFAHEVAYGHLRGYWLGRERPIRIQFDPIWADLTWAEPKLIALERDARAIPYVPVPDKYRPWSEILLKLETLVGGYAIRHDMRSQRFMDCAFDHLWPIAYGHNVRPLGGSQ